MWERSDTTPAFCRVVAAFTPSSERWVAQGTAPDRMIGTCLLLAFALDSAFPAEPSQTRSHARRHAREVHGSRQSFHRDQQTWRAEHGDGPQYHRRRGADLRPCLREHGVEG